MPSAPSAPSFTASAFVNRGFNQWFNPSPTHPVPLTCSSHARLIEPDTVWRQWRVRMDEIEIHLYKR